MQRGIEIHSFETSSAQPKTLDNSADVHFTHYGNARLVRSIHQPITHTTPHGLWIRLALEPGASRVVLLQLVENEEVGKVGMSRFC